MTLDWSDPHNAVLKVELDGERAEMPVNKNLVKAGERILELEGVVVYSPKTDRVYVPMQAVRVLKGDKVGLPAEVRQGTVIRCPRTLSNRRIAYHPGRSSPPPAVPQSPSAGRGPRSITV